MEEDVILWMKSIDDDDLGFSHIDLNHKMNNEDIYTNVHYM
jgi:hypothetical protein